MNRQPGENSIFGLMAGAKVMSDCMLLLLPDSGCIQPWQASAGPLSTSRSDNEIAGLTCNNDAQAGKWPLLPKQSQPEFRLCQTLAALEYQAPPVAGFAAHALRFLGLERLCKLLQPPEE